MYIFFDKRGKHVRKTELNLQKNHQHYRKRIDSKSVYNEKYLKTKMKFYNVKISINFQNNKILPKEGSQCICLSVILITSNINLTFKILGQGLFL